MFTIQDFKVELANKLEVKDFVKKHGEFAAVCYDTPIEKAESVGKHCLQSGHLSGSRHLYFVFRISCVPRSLIDQLVRHDVGVVKNVQSLRYVDKGEAVNIFIAPQIASNADAKVAIMAVENYINYQYKNIKETFAYTDMVQEELNQLARTIIPIGIESACSFAVNLEGLINLANKRLCTRAELPIRTLVKKMVDLVIEQEPLYAPYLVPQCEKLGYCPESKSCGRKDKKHE